jgi:hypothetical protein
LHGNIAINDEGVAGQLGDGEGDDGRRHPTLQWASRVGGGRGQGPAARAGRWLGALFQAARCERGGGGGARCWGRTMLVRGGQNDQRAGGAAARVGAPKHTATITSFTCANSEMPRTKCETPMLMARLSRQQRVLSCVSSNRGSRECDTTPGGCLCCLGSRLSPVPELTTLALE